MSTLRFALALALLIPAFACDSGGGTANDTAADSGADGSTSDSSVRLSLVASRRLPLSYQSSGLRGAS